MVRSSVIAFTLTLWSLFPTCVLSHGRGSVEFLSQKGRIEVDDTAGMQEFDWGGFSNFGKISYAQPFYDKCLSAWQGECRKLLSGDDELKNMMCEKHLNREYLKARMLVDRKQVYDSMSIGPESSWRNESLRDSVLKYPHYTPLGVKKVQAPDHIHAAIQKWFREGRAQAVPETGVPVAGNQCNNAYDNDDYVLPWGDKGWDQVQSMRHWLRKELAEWTGQEILEQDTPIIYGARMYHRGSLCGLHTDNDMTHIISAIYNIDAKGMDSPWPLHVVNHQGEEQAITAKPGELIFYESTTVPHGRRLPLNGTEVVNMFLHFKPKGWDQTRSESNRRGSRAKVSKLLGEKKLSFLERAKGKSAAEKNRMREAITEEIARTVHRKTGDACLPLGHGFDYSAGHQSGVMYVAPGLHQELQALREDDGRHV